MSIKSDHWIRRMAATGMIEPFEPGQVRSVDGRKIVSYGTSSYGYDVRCANEFKIFTNVLSSIVDPKNFDPKSFVEFTGDVCVVQTFLTISPIKPWPLVAAQQDGCAANLNGEPAAAEIDQAALLEQTAQPAGVIAAETIRKQAPDDHIVLVGDEPRENNLFPEARLGRFLADRSVVPAAGPDQDEGVRDGRVLF